MPRHGFYCNGTQKLTGTPQLLNIQSRDAAESLRTDEIRNSAYENIALISIQSPFPRLLSAHLRGQMGDTLYRPVLNISYGRDTTAVKPYTTGQHTF